MAHWRNYREIEDDAWDDPAAVALAVIAVALLAAVLWTFVRRLA